MLFHRFGSQEERREYGGSCFLELQYCRLPRGTAAERITAVDSINDWNDDSLYVYYGDEDEEIFYREYRDIFTGGIYNNLETGPYDPYGINWYDPCAARRIREMLAEKQPEDHETLEEWLAEGEGYNGFYLLGI